MRSRFSSLPGALLAIIAGFCCLASCASERLRPAPSDAAPAPPPLARVEPFRESIQGVDLVDPYRWMENADDPELQTWVAAQRRYAEATLELSPGWKTLRDEFAETFSALPTLGRATPIAGGALVHRWLPDGLTIQFLADGAAHEVALITPALLTAAGRPARIREISPSWDGRYVAVATTGGGDAAASVSVVEVATGALLPDFVPDLLTATSGSRYRVTWTPDSAGFVYPRLAPGALSGPTNERLARGRQFLHRLGRPVSEDVALFGFGVDASIALALDDLPASTVAAPGSPWLVATLSRVAEDRSEVWAARWNSGFGGAGEVGGWRLVASSGYGTLRLRGDELHALTALGADRRRIVARDLAAPAIDAIDWREVVPERAGVLHDYVLTPEAIYFTELEGARMSLSRWRANRAEPIALEVEGGRRFASHVPANSEPWVEASNWIDAGGWFRVPREGSVAVRVGIEPGGDAGAAAAIPAKTGLLFEARQVEVEPGVRVPISIVRPSQVADDGAPVLLEAYGGYGSIQIPELNPFAALWARQGGIYVYAHVRGGRELGESWHSRARREGKIASTTDVLGVAKQLIAEGLTRPGRIALLGTSAGAQLPGLALALAPELFGAVVFNVGTPDEIRGAELDPTAARNIGEMGDMTSRHGVELLREFSPYHRVPATARFPAIVVKTARDDYNFGGAAADLKYVARLQAANRGERPILWLDLPGGHSDVFSDDPEAGGRMMAFLLWQTGHPEFRP